MRIDIRGIPLTFDFNRYNNSYEVRNNKGLLIEVLRNDYVATRYLMSITGIDEEAVKRMIACTFLAGLRK